MPEPERTPTGQATVTVAGAGAAGAVPDTALLQLDVETRGSTPAEALEACRQALDQVLAALDAEGVEPARRTTSGLELHEDWESRQPGRGPAAYLAGARLTVRLARPEQAGQVAAAAVAVAGAGARVHGLGVRGRRPGGGGGGGQGGGLAGRVAPGRAVRGAGRRPLGPVIEIKEAPLRPGRPPDAALAAEAAPAGPATEPGETTIWAAVTVTWSLHPR